MTHQPYEDGAYEHSSPRRPHDEDPGPYYGEQQPYAAAPGTPAEQPPAYPGQQSYAYGDQQPYPGQEQYPGQQAYPGTDPRTYAYENPQQYGGQQPYPGQRPYPGQDGYPAGRQPYAGQPDAQYGAAPGAPDGHGQYGAAPGASGGYSPDGGAYDAQSAAHSGHPGYGTYDQPVPQSQSQSQPQSQPQPQAQATDTDTAFPLPQQQAEFAEFAEYPAAGQQPGARGPADREPAPAAFAAPGHEAAPAPVPPRDEPLTEAQRARAEGRSPVIEPGLQPAGLTALLALILCGASAAGAYGLVVPLVLLQAVTAAGWFRLNGMWPARQGILLAFAAGLTADAAVLAGGRGNAPVALLGAIALAVLGTVVLQLRSHASADERMTALMATLTSAALTVVAAGHLAAPPEAVGVGGAAVALAMLVRALPLPTAPSALLALLAAAGMGAVTAGVSALAGDASTAEGAVIGLAAGLCALVGHRAASYDYPSRFVHMTAGVALPLAAAAPAVYLAGELLG
ncbi:hypothetical protein [Streptomyces sp. SCSIO ZS0520]|uniref:hypothetical protein n=1 Tax=Streptomyces sp. SCSIO ZS0520 TaxID=2892996 RepID=UPI0021D9367A|nr:hypothetical protein [Streptomyces sp. SCSIO ZS0520]